MSRLPPLRLALGSKEQSFWRGEQPGLAGWSGRGVQGGKHLAQMLHPTPFCTTRLQAEPCFGFTRGSACGRILLGRCCAHAVSTPASPARRPRLARPCCRARRGRPPRPLPPERAQGGVQAVCGPAGGGGPGLPLLLHRRGAGGDEEGGRGGWVWWWWCLCVCVGGGGPGGRLRAC